MNELHECDCECHGPIMVMHFMPCCSPCSICNKDIKIGRGQYHLEEDHSEFVKEIQKILEE